MTDPVEVVPAEALASYSALVERVADVLWDGETAHSLELARRAARSVITVVTEDVLSGVELLLYERAKHRQRVGEPPGWWAADLVSGLRKEAS